MSGKANLHYTQNRELSWLKFNQRVLEEAQDETVPLYERLKFVSIFTSNLDEFFMIRVGSLYDLSLLKNPPIDNKSGLTPAAQLDAIFASVIPLYKQRDSAYRHIQQQLADYTLCHVAYRDLTRADLKYLDAYFQSYILPVLSPQVVDLHHPFPHLANKALYIAVTLQRAQMHTFGLVPIPSSLPRVLFLPGGGVRYILLEDFLVEYVDLLFDMYNVTDRTILSVTRNADINPNDASYDFDEDYRHHMKKILKKRSRLAPVRLEIQGSISEPLLAFLTARLSLPRQQVFYSKTPLDLSFVGSLAEHCPLAVLRQLSYPPFAPQQTFPLPPKQGVLQMVAHRDVLLAFPYQSMQPFLQLLREASQDPAVLSIRITIYRLSNKAKLVEYLCAAAENGKDVTVLMELRARFDEQNNINWAGVLEDSGCTVLYGFEEYKVHSKICLITRREKGHIQYITQIGTGNYNEKTAALYTDLSLITAHPAIGQDAAAFFKNMSIGNLDGVYQQLLVAPSSLKSGLLRCIDAQTERAKNGLPSAIRIKINSLTDRQLIDALVRASQSGVQVDLIVRGICCLVPGIPGETEHVTVRSIVGRFLEHSRIYCFGVGDDMQMYISSADFMTRNTERRVEIACPILDPSLKMRIWRMLNIIMQDNVKARLLDRDAGYHPIPVDQSAPRIDSQAVFMQMATTRAAELAAARDSEHTPVRERLQQWLHRHPR